ncbi:hypothetical protein FS837_003796 [Tulasnella sp. UAMH 9824]|nr:hypothetical protein FS837_003796 [Tulasnella sp. UAMH 9824]
MATSAREPPIAITSEALEPPHEFGQDGGKFYRCYDAFAEEIDEDMSQGLKEQLDGLLVFAGLFAGANTAFLAFTLPLMSADPADDTNALLLQTNAILLQMALGRNMSIEVPTPLPSTKFSPPKDMFVVNVLFAVSLSFALISSFLAVLGRQWLVYYRKRGGSGPDRRRWEQLKRYLGAERWHLELVLDDILPTLLQIGLILFCIAIVIYLDTLDHTLSRIVGGLLAAALGIFVLTAMFTTWDRFCPFHSPLSHFISWALLCFLHLITKAPFWFSIIVPYILALPDLALDLCISSLYLVQKAIPGMHFAVLDGYDPNSTALALLRSTRDRVLDEFPPLEIPQVLPFCRDDEEIGWLQVKAIKRVITTSDDPIPISHATANIIAMEDRDALHQLWSDEEFCRRLVDLSRVSNEKTAHFYLHNHTATTPSAGPRMINGALAHIFLMGSDLDLPASRPTSLFFRSPQGSLSVLSIPHEMIHKASSRSIKVSLVWKYILDREGYSNYVNKILEIAIGASGRQDWQLPGGFTPAVVSLMALAASRAEVSDAWADVHGPYTSNTPDIPEHINDALMRRLISRHGGGNSRSREDRMLISLLRIAIKLVRSSNSSNMEDAVTGIKLLALGDSGMLLRDANVKTSVLNHGKAFRAEFATTLQDVFNRAASAGSAIPTELLSELGDYFVYLATQSGREATYEEDLWVVSLFSPILETLFLLDPFARKRHQAALFQDNWLEHKALCGVVLRAFCELKEKVRRMENVRAKRDLRDPDVAWCQHQAPMF